MKKEIFTCGHCKREEPIKDCNEKGETVFKQRTDDLFRMRPGVEIKLTIHADTKNTKDTKDEREQVVLCKRCVRHLLREVSIH